MSCDASAAKVLANIMVEAGMVLQDCLTSTSHWIWVALRATTALWLSSAYGNSAVGRTDLKAFNRLPSSWRIISSGPKEGFE